MSVKSQLVSGDNFLHLSRTQPELFSQPQTFTLDNQTQVDIAAEGIIQFTPAQSGDKDIVLSCGIHGNETAPIEICDHMVQQILTGAMQLKHRVLFIFGNLPAMDIAQRFVEENMNRLFSGAHQAQEEGANSERIRAGNIERWVADFYQQRQGRRFHYDLHTAIRASKNDKFVVYPYRHGKPWKREQLSFLLACGINTILLSDGPTTTFSYYSSNEFGADAFTVELGKVKPFGQNNMADFQAAQDTLIALVSQDEISLAPFVEDDFNIFQVHRVINRTQEDFSLNFADDVPNFTDFPLDYVLASETGAEYRVNQQGEAIVFPNAKVALGQRALLTVVPTKLDK